MKQLIIAVAVGIAALLCSGRMTAQTIKGAVTDSTGKPVAYASAKLLSQANLIVAFSTTDPKGNYSLSVPAGTDQNGLKVEVSSVGYKKDSKVITSLSVPYDFKLHSSTNQLQAVTVKNTTPRLKVRGDTLAYSVAEFSAPQDRVIGDVIKRLPGVDVDANGKISYNGKAISNLYIGGDNLLDDKYNIATKTIPNGVVDKVEIMENHQPVKMLQDKVVSDDVAINLTIKDGAKLQMSGQGNAGGGLPGKYDGEVNSMMFKDKYKAINYLKGNNTGVEVQNDLISHNLSTYLTRLDNNKPDELLSLGAAGNPNLPTNRYLFNQSALLNLNNLVNVKKDVQVKANVSYLRDRQLQNYTKIRETYLPNDTIRLLEIQDNRRRPDLLHAQATLNINKPKYYLNNIFMSDYEHNSSYSGLNANGVGSDQTLKNSRFDISNEFNIMKTSGSGNIFEGYSYIDRINNPENRLLQPGINQDVFNGNQPYAQLIQTANIPTLFTNNYVSFRHPGNKVTQSYKAGFSLQSQQLRSALSVVQNSGSTVAASSTAANDLDWFKSKIFTEAAYDIPGDNFKLNIRLPLSWQHINYNDPLYALDKSLTRVYFDPYISARYNTAPEQYIAANYTLRNTIGSITEAYRGDILTNYRTLMANNADLSERRTQNVGLGYNYRRAIKMFFWGVNASYSHVNMNNITSGVITDNFQRQIVLPYANEMNTWMVNGSISKYVYSLHTTFGAGYSWQSTKLNQFLNGQLLPYTTNANSANGSAETKISNRVNTSYRITATHTNSRSSVNNAASAGILQLQHQLAINYNPSNNLFLKLSGDHYYTDQAIGNDLNYSFADLSARYKINSAKTDIELNVLNMLNTKDYSAPYLTANNFTNSVYRLPGRMVTMKVSFTF
ncbi:TonB-dependent receptor [Mucilaginibacter daejeonensis]|uniref:TonB-dependent receptor n=1 Tax=Mucilaginibacter daejeonensis TaxID=398049 RepID=UPI001D177DAA|nr:TonB-dependent receptor [Mucilaginibacter daejeonensis]UEG54599.1 TonB-dependent receptor [Mucilaginibacter daejeonensis]